MNDNRTRLPHLDRFLNAYMHQDWQIYGKSVEDVLKSYALDTSPADLGELRTEIETFIRVEGDRAELDYYKLYPNSVLPSGWSMTVKEWLRLVADKRPF